MATDAHLIVRLVEAARADHQFRVIVALETGPWDNVEHAVRAVPVAGIVAPALDFQKVDVLRVELGSDVTGDVRVRYRHAVNQPADLMTAPDVQLVVRDVRPGHEGRYGLKAVGPISAGRVLDVLAVHEGGRCHRIRADACRARGNRH